MLPYNPGGHAAYQDLVVSQLRKYYPNFNDLPPETQRIAEHFFSKDLSQVDDIMRERYSVFGPEPRLPSCMLRSILVALEFKISNYTHWSSHLKLNPLFAIISGFEVGDTPGVGTFYDFNKRLWLSPDKNLSPHEHPTKASVRKPSKDGDKAKSIDKETVEELLNRLELEPPSVQQPFSLLFQLFKTQFIDESVDRGLIDPHHLTLAGDGMPFITSAKERKKRICDCKEKGITDCGCDRFYSQPDCDIGWDSSRKCFYHGYDLYSFTVAGKNNDLPLFSLPGPASRHDSHGFLHSWFMMRGFFPDFHADKLILDSAHDAMPIYAYCRRKQITPFIDLNEKRGIAVKYKDQFIIGSDGVPVCPAGRKMWRDGSEKKKYRLKFRCPLSSRKHGCSCANPCSGAKDGRTIHIPMKDNPRLINIPPRGTQQWDLQYNARTSAERNNKRQKIDYKLEDGKHRSSREWYCRLFGIMMCQHMDAWDLPYTSTLKGRLSSQVA